MNSNTLLANGMSGKRTGNENQEMKGKTLINIAGDMSQ